MSDPYRSAAFRCLRCEDAPLRRLMGDRLVCNTCGGLMLELEDLEGAVGDLTVEPLRFADEGLVERACPRCPRKLERTELQVGKHGFDGLLRCVDHGVWFDAAQLVHLFEELGRLGGRGAGRGGGRYYGGVGDVLILHGRRPKPKPRGPMFVTAHADRMLGCPRCRDRALAFAAGRWTCGGCRGVFVEDAALVTMITAMTGAPWELPAPSAGEGAHPCPICTAGMTAEDLEGVAADRCAGHGVWFDADELEAALHHTTRPGSRGLRRWLRSLL